MSPDVRYDCTACEFAVWDDALGGLRCQHRQPGFSAIGEHCRRFLRYPGAEYRNEREV